MSAGDDLAERLDGIVHAPTQVHEDRVDLTVEGVSVVEEPGWVDFGGGELETAGTAPVETRRRNEGDDYGWWRLEGGTYLLEYNESLTGGEPVGLRTRPALAARGASHPALRTASLGPVPLTVADGGVRIKENARVSVLVPGR